MTVELDLNNDNVGDNWNRAVRNRMIASGTVPLVGDIDDSFLESFLAPLEYLVDSDDDNIKSITLIINSGGGDASWLGRAMRTIARSRRPIIAYIDEACSAAFMIAMACHIRFCYPTSIMMHHKSYTEVGGSGKELILQASMVDALDDACTKLLFDRTDITREILEEHRDNNWWITPEYALKLGVVHEILDFNYTLSEVTFQNDRQEEVRVVQTRPTPVKSKRKRKR